MRAWPARQVLQYDEQEPAYVATPQTLEMAILQGRHHIVVTAHLDMTALPLRPTSICKECVSPLPETFDTVSIRVRS